MGIIRKNSIDAKSKNAVVGVGESTSEYIEVKAGSEQSCVTKSRGVNSPKDNKSATEVLRRYQASRAMMMAGIDLDIKKRTRKVA